MSHVVTLRPSEKVLAFLEHEFQLQKLPEGGRLPTIGDLAQRLDVSEGTIKAAYRELSRKGVIYSVRGRGSFRAAAPPAKPATSQHCVIGINIKEFPGPQEGPSWAARLTSGILNEARKSDLPIDLRLCGEADNLTEAELEARVRGISGMIFFKLGSDDRYYTLLKRLGIPLITVNQPFINATANFVSPDYLSSSIQLGRIWRHVGKKRILFFSAPHPDASISIQERLGGLAAGLGDALGRDCELQVLVNTLGSAESARAKMADFLASGTWIPDAIYSAGDAMQEGILEVLEERGLSVPDQVSLVGGNGVVRTIGRKRRYQLASAAHPAERIGELLLKQVMTLIRNQGAALPGIIVPVPLLTGDTVTDVENAAFRQLAAGASPSF